MSETTSDPALEQGHDAEIAELLRKQQKAEAEKNIAENERAARLADPSTEEGKLQQQKSLAETRKAIAEAEKGAFEAAFPRGTTQPLEGKIEADEKSGYVAEIVGYRAMDESATAIAAAIDEAQLGDHPKILIVDSTNVIQADMPLEQVRRQMNLIRVELEAQKGHLEALVSKAEEPRPEAARGLQAVPAAVGATTSVVSQLADLVSYFRSDYSLKGRVFAVSDLALTAAIAGKIKKAEAYVLNFYRLFADELPIITTFEQVLELRKTIEKKMDEVNSKVIDPKSRAVTFSRETLQKLQIDILAAEAEKRGAIQTQIATEQGVLAGFTQELETAQAVVSAWKAAAATIDANLKAMVSSGEEKPPLLLQAAAREQVLEMTHLLYVKVSSSGGESVTKRSLWPWAHQRVNYLGGGAVTYFLSTREGRVVAADTITALGCVNYDLADGAAEERKPIFAPTPAGRSGAPSS